MHLVLEKLVIKNFLSYGYAEIDLQDRGFCLVDGINNCLEDNASNNGSGKSSWGSAICWALTGQTINGLTQNIKNIFIEEDSCYVELSFKVDNTAYKIIRFKEPKSDLKIFINGEDKSGKGLRESEALLKTYLPELSPDLIASIIILGQGLPYKFSGNTPSGRKEVLEKLSKSDFMINDIRERIVSRSEILSEAKRKYEDLALTVNTKIQLATAQLTQKEKELSELSTPHNFEDELKDMTEQISIMEKDLQKIAEDITASSGLLGIYTNDLTAILHTKDSVLLSENADFSAMKEEYLMKKVDLEHQIKNLKNEILRLKAITDICPTCGQKLHNVVKPDTSAQEKTLQDLTATLSTLNTKYSGFEKEHLSTIANIDQKYAAQLSIVKENIEVLQQKISNLQFAKQKQEKDFLDAKEKLTQIKLEKESFSKKLTETKDFIISQKAAIKLLEDDLLYNNKEKDHLSDQLNIINQMMTLIKRDFRGFLLSNVISFIDSKAKEYCQEVFGTKNLQFELNGNNIDISYCGKIFESLSGGEKQKVDLILQLAIRDMMSQYLNFSSNILILDEITDNLDVTGCSNILNLITTKLEDLESIFIISHHANELGISGDSTLTIVKDNKGISSVKQ